MADQILNSIKGRYSVANLQKKNDPLQSQCRTCQRYCVYKICLNSVHTSIKGRNPFANLPKTIIYITDVDLVNDNEYTKFSLILSIRSQVIELKPNYGMNQGP